MQRPVFRATLVAAISVAVACGPVDAPPPDPDEMIAAANALDRRLVTAFNAGDHDAIVDLYWDSPEAAAFPPDTMVLRGIEGIRTGGSEALSRLHAAGARLEILEAHQIPAGDVVIGWGLWRLTRTEADAEITSSGRYTNVKAQRDGKWVYLVDHASVPQGANTESGNLESGI